MPIHRVQWLSLGIAVLSCSGGQATNIEPGSLALQPGPQGPTPFISFLLELPDGRLQHRLERGTDRVRKPVVRLKTLSRDSGTDCSALPSRRCCPCETKPPRGTGMNRPDQPR